MEKKYLALTALVVGIMSLSAVSVFAATPNEGQKFNGRGQEFAGLTQEERTVKMEEMKVKHEEIQKAVLDGNYDAWSKLVSEMPMGSERLDVITEANFAKFTEAHKLMAQSDVIFTELGMEKGPKGRGPGMGK